MEQLFRIVYGNRYLLLKIIYLERIKVPLTDYSHPKKVYKGIKSLKLSLTPYKVANNCSVKSSCNLFNVAAAIDTIDTSLYYNVTL